MSRTLHCRHCDGASDFIGGAFPTHCGKCGKPTTWRTESWLLPDPRKPYALTDTDRSLLKSLKIKVDEEPQQV